MRTRMPIAALAFALLVTGAARAQTAPGDPPAPQAGEPDAHHHAMPHDDGMMARHQEYMKKVGEMDARLDGLVAAMNAARGTAKVDATAAVVSELVAQRKQMLNMLVQGMHEMHEMRAPGEMGGVHHPGMAMGHGEHGMACCAGMKGEAGTPGQDGECADGMECGEAMAGAKAGGCTCCKAASPSGG
jgi:hypothetical protein